MKSIIYIGMDVHKKTYSLCALLKESKKERKKKGRKKIMKRLEEQKQIFSL